MTHALTPAVLPPEAGAHARPVHGRRAGAILVPRLVADAGPDAAERFLEFFTARIKNLQIIVLTSAVLSMVGCATIANGTSQRIKVSSEPPGAEVFVASELVGTTPTEIVMSRRSVNPQVRVVDQRGNSEYRRLGNSLSGWMWLDLVGALVLGYAVYPKFPGEENPEGSVRIGLLAALIPAAVDFTLGGAYKFPSRIDFRQRSAKGHEPFMQKPMRPVQSDRGVLRGDVQSPRHLDVGAVFDIPQLHDLLKRRRQVVDGLQQQAP